jgi:outer membrane protein insertion porin family
VGFDLVFGEVDDPLGPREGYITRLSTEFAGPAAISDVEYSRLEAQVTGMLPLGRSTGLVARVSAGRLFPRGASVPSGPDDLLSVLLQLRDAVFTAGGTGDVRGWGNGQLGPKVPDIRVVQRGDSVTVSADRYVVLAGLARATASVELRLPFPFLGAEHGTHLFLDAGRIWNPDDRFRDPDLPADPLNQEDVFFGTGFGVEFATLVGPLSIDLGYKLNPSPLDLRDPGDVARALVAGQSLFTVPIESLRRWHLHFAIGRSF